MSFFLWIKKMGKFLPETTRPSIQILHSECAVNVPLSCTSSVILFIGVRTIGVLLVRGYIPTLPIIFRWTALLSVFYSISLLFLVTLMPLTWAHFLWNEFHASDSDSIPQPKNVVLRLFHGISLKTIWNIRIRYFLYIVICFLFTLCLFTKMVRRKYYFYLKRNYNCQSSHLG